MDLEENSGGPPVNVDWRDFAQRVTRNTMRYVRIFSQARMVDAQHLTLFASCL